MLFRGATPAGRDCFDQPLYRWGWYEQELSLGFVGVLDDGDLLGFPIVGCGAALAGEIEGGQAYRRNRG